MNSYNLYNYYGVHQYKEGYIFRVYAPNAVSVAVIGDFNNWNTNANIMNKDKGGTFSVFVKEAKELDHYKYLIDTGKKQIYKSDPFSFLSEYEYNHNSIIYNLDNYKWNDNEWIQKRDHLFNKPLNIYEVHLGSWKRENGYLNYRNIAEILIPYVKKNGFTHVELMPITEYPYDGSWGYQVSCYYSVTSRFGTPKDFMYFVDFAHQNNIGVIVDWVPGHFPKDDFGLIEFDGTYLYEDHHELRREHKRWGTRVFDFEKPWVKKFLISNAHFFYSIYHIDGIRVDAVASMLYLDYDRDLWQQNIFGGNYNFSAINFLKELNTIIYQAFPYAMMIAEESTDFKKVTTPVYNGGLGFSYKWNMGWMNDSLKFIGENNRLNNIDKLTFSFLYAYNENYLLPISHDEVVHGKKSLLNKMIGNYDEKFQNHRLYYGFMMTHPGKKLSFMGNEFGQFIEWDYNKELDWFLLEYPKHKMLHLYYRELNHFYLENSPLWELDHEKEGFRWVQGNELLIFKRFNKSNDELLIILNFNSQPFYQYKFSLNNQYVEVFNSDNKKYGGKGIINKNITNGLVNIGSYSIIILKPFF